MVEAEIHTITIGTMANLWEEVEGKKREGREDREGQSKMLMSRGMHKVITTDIFLCTDTRTHTHTHTHTRTHAHTHHTHTHTHTHTLTPPPRVLPHSKSRRRGSQT